MELCGRKLEADMFVLDTRGYDVVLGMTWLSKYHAVIDCRNKKVIFRIPCQPEFQFLGLFAFCQVTECEASFWSEANHLVTFLHSTLVWSAKLSFRGKLMLG